MRLHPEILEAVAIAAAARLPRYAADFDYKDFAAWRSGVLREALRDRAPLVRSQVGYTGAREYSRECGKVPCGSSCPRQFNDWWAAALAALESQGSAR